MEMKINMSVGKERIMSDEDKERNKIKEVRKKVRDKKYRKDGVKGKNEKKDIKINNIDKKNHKKSNKSNNNYQKNSDEKKGYSNDKKVIVISGTPGTGKTTVANKIIKMLKPFFDKGDIDYVNVKEFVEKHKIYDYYDKNLETFIVDVDTFIDELRRYIDNSNYVLFLLDGHLGSYLPKEITLFTVITECDIRILKKRLEDRGYSEVKVRDNLDSEIFKECYYDALDNKHKISVINTSFMNDEYENNVKEIAKKIKRYLKITNRKE